MPKINAEQFREAFAKVWQENRGRTAVPLYPCRPYTQMMVGDGGILSTVADQFKLIDQDILYHRELYTVDAVILGGCDVFRMDLCYPSSIYALIEHETAYYPEEEMWKLLHWRCPLKIIIMYDWSDEEKRTRVGRRSWMENKITILRKMRDQIYKFQGDEPDTDYLFLIGYREVSDGPITRWSYASSADGFNMSGLATTQLNAA
jgi:hypothetical protein